jgi:hypothetical protein
MKDYVKRMLGEEKELRTRCKEFEKFVSNEDNMKTLSTEEQKLMWQKFGFMEAHYKVLTRIIELQKVPLLK